MPVGGGRLIDRLAQIQIARDATRREVEHLVHRGLDGPIGHHAGAERLDVHGHRLNDTDRVGHLYFTTRGELGGHDVLGHPAGGVAGRAVHLGRILAAERPAAVTTHAAVRVDDDLTPGQSSIALRAADHEAPRWIDVRLEPLGQILFGDRRHDDVVEDGASELRVRDLFVVLRGNDDRVDRDGPTAFVDHRHLRLAIRAEPRQRAVLAQRRQAMRERVRELNRQRHQFHCFIGRVAEHHALIAGAAGVHALRNVGRLRVDRAHDGARLVVEAERSVGVADPFDRLAHDVGQRHVGRGRDLAGDDHQTRRDQRFTGHACRRILGQDGVEHGIGNLVRDLVRMSFGHGLRRKQVTIGHAALWVKGSCERDSRRLVR